GDPRLTFRAGDIYDLEFRSEFDIVTCARVLQWLSRPRAALDSLIRAAVSGGRVRVLDYNHEKAAWEPDRRQRSAGFTRPFSPGAGRRGWTTPSPTAWSTCLRRRGCWTWPPRRSTRRCGGASPTSNAGSASGST